MPVRAILKAQMKLRMLLPAFLVVLLAPASHAQVTAYLDFSASRFANLTSTSYLYGPTGGITYGLLGPKFLQVSADIRASTVGSNGKRFTSVGLGPQLSLHVKHFHPYAGLLVGFARYNDGLGNPASASTDSLVSFPMGVDRPIFKRLDWRIFDYEYSLYYGLGGQFNPKKFSTGLVFHLN